MSFRIGYKIHGEVVQGKVVNGAFVDQQPNQN
jgi:hypothetical protein